MKVGEYCKREVVSINLAADALDAARLMREEHIGFLVVYSLDDELRKPVGVVTDRDLVLGVMAKEVSPQSVTVGDVMTRQPLVANESDDFKDLLQAMRVAGVRRAPVVDIRGALVGVIAIDDAIDAVTGLMCDIAGSIRSEQRQEWRARPSAA
jgi:predicted transcriptional regulator